MSVAVWVIAVALAAPGPQPQPQRPASMDAPPVAAETPAPAPEPTPEPPAPEPTPAPEPASGDDEVVLKNGGFVRGEVVELLPNDRVVIIVDGTTERRTIAWAEIERVERGGSTTIPTALPQPEPQSEQPQSGAPRLHLNVHGGKSVRLYEIGSEISANGTYGSMYGIQYRVVCESPCGRVIDGTRGQDFFLGRDTMTASRRFTLAQHSGDVTLDVKPGSKALRLTGSIFVGLGIGLTIAGIIFVIPQQFRYLGWPMLGGGLGGIAIGTPMMILGRTRFKIAD